MKRLLPLLFILGGCILLALGGAVFGAVVYFQNPSASAPDPLAWKPPLEQVDKNLLAAGTVLLPLTGVTGTDALSAALDKAHLENAYAVLAYDATLSDATRVGGLLQLGTRYANAKDAKRATQCFQAAALLATLSPALSDFARLDTYLQASAGLRGLGATEAARLVTDQAYLAAQFSPTLQQSQRARRLDQVADAYFALNVSNLGSQARGKSVEAATAGATTPITGTRAPFAPAGAKLPAAPEIDQARNLRVKAAKQLQDDLLDNAPKTIKDWKPNLVEKLGDTLFDEDRARRAYYDKQLAGTKDVALKIALWRDKLDWLALKSRVARGGFGASLVVEWEKDRATIAEDWTTAWDELYRLYEQQAAALPKPPEINAAREDLVQQKLIAARWGWFAAAEPDLIEQLNDVTQTLMDTAYPSLRLDTFVRNKRTLFLLVPDELYGLKEKALPK